MRITKADLKNLIYRKPFAKRLSLMLIGVFVMGICVAFMRMCHLGTDPFSAINYGLVKYIPLSFGTLELIFNGILLILVVFNDISRLGWGTLGNMIIVGYTADLVSFIMSKFFGITSFDSMPVRIAVMLAAVLVFVFACALYINAGLGSSAYDALPFVIHDKLCAKTHKNIPLKFVRMAFDAVFTALAFVLHGEAGIITVLMVLTLGPVIDYVSKLLSSKLGF